MFLPPKPKAAYGGTRRKSRLWRYEQPLGARPRNPPRRLRMEPSMRSVVGISGLQAGEDVNNPYFGRMRPVTVRTSPTPPALAAA